MYQSNQARIKKENPSLLPGRGRMPRGRLSLALTALAGIVARRPLPLPSTLPSRSQQPT
jgi:hypothetical protein